MNKKIKIILFAILVIAVIFAVVTVYNEFQKTCCAPEPEDKISANIFSTNINGYYVTCVSKETISKRTENFWEEVKEALPKEKGGYYLDDKFVDFVPENDLGCDYLSCIELPKPYTVELIEHKKMGDKPPPSNSRKVVESVPVYETVSLRGDIKIDIDYYSDKNCSEKRAFSTVVSNESSKITSNKNLTIIYSKNNGSLPPEYQRKYEFTITTDASGAITGEYTVNDYKDTKDMKSVAVTFEQLNKIITALKTVKPESDQNSDCAGGSTKSLKVSQNNVVILETFAYNCAGKSTNESLEEFSAIVEEMLSSNK